ncbi:PREDICTED: protein SGT1 homolog A-like isoform X4 [Acropora digitifera]|uniref:protein SGT1 homolog A-like isoform X4 n=1 Tax=Acropora digitifera TaxID=70779 RepID=UPI00077A79D6|nr:PREDICTED: protein SGT1 homolog A-like isoform X4 [Acropora digitifera]
MASELIREGNEAFVDDNYDLAVKKYTEAIQLSGSDAEFFLKRAAAYMKLGQFEQAAADGSAAVNLQPKNSKAHARKGITKPLNSPLQMLYNLTKTTRNYRHGLENAMINWVPMLRIVEQVLQRR